MLRRLICIIVLLNASVALAKDSCASRLPSSLRQAFARDFPAFRLVEIADYSRETLDLEKSSTRGTACLAVASGHFNSDSRRDFVFLALRPKGTVHGFVALRESEGWRLAEIWDLSESYAGCCYADILPPGRYENVYGPDPDPESPLLPDERLEYTSSTEAPVVGAVASTGIAFFLAGSQWLHVWISD